MKKWTILIAVLLCMSMLLCACSGSAGASKPLADIYAELKPMLSSPDEMNDLTAAAQLDRYYGITEDQVEEFAGGINNTGVVMDEIVLIKAKDDAAASAVKTALENRLTSKLNENKNYNPEQAAIIEQCSVEQNGLYVSLIIAENASEITEKYHSFF